MANCNFPGTGNLRAHYTKTTVKAGEILRLVAIFQDTKKCNSISFGIPSGSSEKDQYAQCLDPLGREVFAPLSARGEFYAVCQSDDPDKANDAVLYKVQHLVNRPLPLRVSMKRQGLLFVIAQTYVLCMRTTSTRDNQLQNTRKIKPRCYSP